MKGKRSDIIYFFIMLLFALGVFLVAGHYKRIIFCDEVYTYSITNSDMPIYHFAVGEWYSGSQAKEMLSHSEADGIMQMLRNVKADKVHPPLYYMVVYLFSAIASGSCSKWIGLSVNCVFFMGTVIMLWLIMRRLFSSAPAALAAIIIYSMNISTLSDLTLVRMYMAVTFFVAAFAYVNLRLTNKPDDKKEYIWLMLITAGGFLTQYYFALFAVGVFLVEAVVKLKRKSYKQLGMYLLSMVTAVVLSTICWPYWISAVLNNSHSDAMASSALGLLNVGGALLEGIKLLQITLFQNAYIAGGIVVLLVLVLFGVLTRGKDEYIYHRHLVVQLLAATILYSVVVGTVTPDYLTSTRYFYPAAMLEILTAIICGGVLLKLYAPAIVRAAAVAAVVVLEVVLLVFGTGIDYYGNAKEYDEQLAILKEYADVPWIISGGETWQITANMFDYCLPEQLLVINEASEYREEPILEEAEGFIIIANDEQELVSDGALYYYIGCTGAFVSDELLFVRNGLSIYYATPIKE